MPAPNTNERNIERFWKAVEKTATCWLWKGPIESTGYGRFHVGLKAKPAHFAKPYVLAHRFAYEHCVGPIPEGLQIDHVCRNRACVNPLHMEPVTAKVNLLRGIGLAAQNARKKYCKRGHPLSGSNLLPRKNNVRQCRTCANALCRARRAAAKRKDNRNESRNADRDSR